MKYNTACHYVCIYSVMIQTLAWTVFFQKEKVVLAGLSCPLLDIIILNI